MTKSRMTFYEHTNRRRSSFYVCPPSRSSWRLTTTPHMPRHVMISNHPMLTRRQETPPTSATTQVTRRCCPAPRLTSSLRPSASVLLHEATSPTTNTQTTAAQWHLFAPFAQHGSAINLKHPVRLLGRVRRTFDPCRKAYNVCGVERCA